MQMDHTQSQFYMDDNPPNTGPQPSVSIMSLGLPSSYGEGDVAVTHWTPPHAGRVRDYGGGLWEFIYCVTCCILLIQMSELTFFCPLNL